MPDGSADDGCRGRELARNAAVARLARATGLRRREFTFLLVFEVPPAPPAAHPPGLPVLFPVPAALAKGGKHRTTWIDADTLHASALPAPFHFGLPSRVSTTRGGRRRPFTADPRPVPGRAPRSKEYVMTAFPSYPGTASTCAASVIGIEGHLTHADATTATGPPGL